MVIVKFSKYWDKMEGIDLDNLVLKRIDKVNMKLMSKEFLDNDRLFGGKVDYSFKFNFRYGIILVFKDCNSNGFMSIRSYNKGKWNYYSKKVGEKVIINWI